MTSSPGIVHKESNTLFPVFLKLEHLRLLIIGGGAVGLEKLTAVLSNSPATRINLVAISIHDEIKKVASHNERLILWERPFQLSDLDDCDLVISAVNDLELSRFICCVD